MTIATAQLMESRPTVEGESSFITDARWYRLSTPLEDYSGEFKSFYVIVSAVNLETGPETMIFPCDSHGQVVRFREMMGSFRGGLDHEKALRNAGYEVVK